MKVSRLVEEDVSKKPEVQVLENNLKIQSVSCVCV